MIKLIIALFIIINSIFAKELQILTEEGPPYNYLNGDKIEGMAVEIVREILKRVNHPDNIKILPWSRAYQATLNGEDYVLFPTTRAIEREDKFKWVGPLFTYKSVFFAKKGSGIKIKSLEDAKNVRAIGVYKDDFQEIFLKARGFTNLVSNERELLNPVKLVLGQIDLWASGMGSGYYNLKWANIDAKEIEPIFTYYEGVNYIAFSKNVPDETIKKWQEALDEIYKDGTYKKIESKYIK